MAVDADKVWELIARAHTHAGCAFGQAKHGTATGVKEEWNKLTDCAIPLAAACEALLAERDKLRDAICDADFVVMETSGKWSIHDVSEKAKADDERTAEVIMRNIDLERRVAELEAELEPLTVDGHYVDIHDRERIANLLAKKEATS